jgi:hypothetical protein
MDFYYDDTEAEDELEQFSQEQLEEREYAGVQLGLATYAALIDIEGKNYERTVVSHSNVDA